MWENVWESCVQVWAQTKCVHENGMFADIVSKSPLLLNMFGLLVWYALKVLMGTSSRVSCRRVVIRELHWRHWFGHGFE